MNKLNSKRRAQRVVALVEDNSVRSTCRMTSVAEGTVLTLLADVGAVCLGGLFGPGRLTRALFDDQVKFLFAHRHHRQTALFDQANVLQTGILFDFTQSDRPG